VLAIARGILAWITGCSAVRTTPLDGIAGLQIATTD
jgi:hypothetical protein